MTNVPSKIRAALWRLSMKGLPRGPHITRFFMYQHLRAVGPTLPRHEGDVLSISNSRQLCELLGVEPRTYVEATYPEHNILSLRFADESFDFVFADQVLEHVEGSPQQAMDECWRVLRPGGIVLHTTCLVYPIHGVPNDFWRFTPAALKLLTRKFAQTVDCGGWGNFEAWRPILDGLRAEGVPLAAWHPYHRLAVKNDPIWPMVTWIIARK